MTTNQHSAQAAAKIGGQNAYIPRCLYAKPEKRLLKPGDLMEAEIEGIGFLRNRVVSAE